MALRHPARVAAVVADAIADGVDLRGFFHWTGVDTTSGTYGFDVQFGCFTRDREPKGSAELLLDYATGALNARCFMVLATIGDRSGRLLSQKPRGVGASRGAVTGVGADGVLVEPLREVQALQDELDAGSDPGRRLGDLEVGEHRPDAFELPEQRSVFGGRYVLACVHDRTAFERSYDRSELLGPDARPEDLEDGRLHDPLEHLALTPVFQRLDLDLAARRRRERVEIGHPRDDIVFTAHQRAARVMFATNVS